MALDQLGVSIVMPVRDGEPFLEEALASVVGQTYENWELVVVDDGSKDRTPEILNHHAERDPRVRVLSNYSTLGVAASLNRAIERSRHSLIARLDADDRSEPQRLARQVRAFQADPDLVLCGTAATLIDVRGEHLNVRQPPVSDHALKRRLIRDNCFVHSSVMYPKRAWAHAGRYPTGVIFEDYWLWIAMARLGNFASLDERLVAHRIHASSRTRSATATAQRVERLRAQMHAARVMGAPARGTYEVARSGIAWLTSEVRGRSDVAV